LNKGNCKYLCIVGLLMSQSAYSATGILEDFSNSINADNFNQTEKVVALDTANQKLILSSGASSTSQIWLSNLLSLNNPGVTSLGADLTVTNLTLGESTTQQASVTIAGTFYNSDSATASTSMGEVWVNVSLGDRGNGLEAWYEVQVSTSDNWSTSTVNQGTIGTIVLDKSHSVLISYDGDKTFSFTLDGGAPLTFVGPNKIGAPYNNRQAVRTRLLFGEDNSTPNDTSDGGTSDGSAATISGTVDNVMSDGALVDAFAAASIDQGIWGSDEFSTKVVNGKLDLIAKSGGTSTQRTSISLKNPDINFLGAKVTLLSTSTQTDTARVRARVGGYWYNDTLDGNGLEGEIFSSFIIERAEGVLQATVGVFRCGDANCDTGTEPFWEKLGTTIAMDTAYEISIEKTASSLVYRMGGEIVYTHDITTQIYPSKDNYKMVRAEIRDDVGEAHARFDDITTDGFADPSPASTGATSTGGSSGGGSFNPFLPLVLWLVYMGIMSRSRRI
jgi:hypothetical protein